MTRTAVALGGFAALAAFGGIAVGVTVGAATDASLGWTSGLAFGAFALACAALLIWLLPAEAMPALSLAVLVLLLLTAGRMLWLGRAALHWPRPGDTALALCFVGLLVLALARPLRTLRRADVRDCLAALAGTSGWLAFLAGMLALTAIYVEASHRLLFWDQLNYWDKTATVAGLVRGGLSWGGFRALLLTAGDEYSMVPAILPGLLTGALRDTGLLAYLLAVALFYVVPALLALGALGFALAGGLDPGLRAAPWKERVALATLGALAAVALLPHFLEVFLHHVMPDIGGVLVLVLLLFAWRRLLRLVLRPDAATDERARALDLLAAGALVAMLSLLGYVFRRWYLFGVAGIGGAALLMLLAALARPARPRRAMLRDAGVAAAAALLAALTGGATVLEQWIIQWRHRNYAESYAGYWSGWPDEFAHFQGIFGLLVPLLGTALVLALLARRGEGALPFLLLAGTALSIAGFYQVQGLSAHHAYLWMPLLSGAAAAGAILAARRVGVRPVAAALLVLGALFGWAPRQPGALALVEPRWVDLWPHSDADMPGLVRLGHWLSETLAPDERYCVAASSPALNNGSIANVWQADPALIGQAEQTQQIGLNQVDSRDGPPDARLRQCAIMIVATPPQTHMPPAEQRSIMLVAEDLMSGTGIGQAFQRLDAAFHLPDGATLWTFRSIRPITDEELRDIRGRFYAEKGEAAARLQARFGPP